MKVTTDACIQGAWTPVPSTAYRALDIGAGTGLLSLMLAQRAPGITIEAIELDDVAAVQARDNVMQSAWADRIAVLTGDVREYRPPHKYDLLISNPPFFNDSLLGKAANENVAHHTLSLSHGELLGCMDAHVAGNGYISILLPVNEYEHWLKLAGASQWYESRRLTVRHTKNAAAKRIVGLFCKDEQTACIHEELIIMGEDRRYTQAFIDLLSPFYLYM